MNNLIQERMDLIEEHVQKLKGIKASAKEFLEYQGIKHTLQEAIEACIDIASHIIAEQGFGRQDSYAAYFTELQKRGIIPNSLSKKLEEMAKFRNLLVHRYHEVEEKELQQIIDSDLMDMIEFIKHVQKYLKKK